ncbi:uncharacterized protein LACBIDRAFT_332883 [Laccaria bicolor S238N-H82]|uniref:Predicted protein n=1 Tax=Laccaria bicolor (strain S238N-H82 / ATCC MYA-4686) TaxID=486041 RepID=B0DU55_LACBS|nr:uncharacterized protein LACBIDRAFT_332883 [Laccaria bicolor S238N-H82]EDR01887.1 predicted protein [Laccaria bicolor S238N-H82]|eukprot:XP_001887497.1 predicted protein [Laccaria bicolor S238N-H82]
MHDNTQRRQQRPRHYKSHTTWQRHVTRMGGDDDNAECQWMFRLDCSPARPPMNAHETTARERKQMPSRRRRRHDPTTHERPPTTTTAHEHPRHDNERPCMTTKTHERNANANAKTNETATHPHGRQYSPPPTTDDDARPCTEDSARVNGNGQQRAQSFHVDSMWNPYGFHP